MYKDYSYQRGSEIGEESTMNCGVFLQTDPARSVGSLRAWRQVQLVRDCTAAFDWVDHGGQLEDRFMQYADLAQAFDSVNYMPNL